MLALLLRLMNLNALSLRFRQIGATRPHRRSGCIGPSVRPLTPELPRSAHRYIVAASTGRHVSMEGALRGYPLLPRWASASWRTPEPGGRRVLPCQARAESVTDEDDGGVKQLASAPDLRGGDVCAGAGDGRHRAGCAGSARAGYQGKPILTYELKCAGQRAA